MRNNIFKEIANQTYKEMGIKVSVVNSKEDAFNTSLLSVVNKDVGSIGTIDEPNRNNKRRLIRGTKRSKSRHLGTAVICENKI